MIEIKYSHNNHSAKGDFIHTGVQRMGWCYKGLPFTLPYPAETFFQNLLEVFKDVKTKFENILR
jgi:hypothetical protein